MTTLDVRTFCAVLALAAAATACNRQDETPATPQSMASSEGAAAQGGTSANPPLPAGSPPGAPQSAPPGAGSPGERGMGGVAGSAAGTSPAPTMGPVAGTDRAFVAEAANNGLAEVEAARLVAARSDNPRVKDLAQQMEKERASINEELKRIASEKGIEMPSTIGGEPRGQLSRLTTLSKPEVDQAFVRDFGIEAHRQAIGLFERQAREGQDPELKAFAERTLPKLREHLSEAEEVAQAAVPDAPVQGQAGPMGSAPR